MTDPVHPEPRDPHGRFAHQENNVTPPSTAGRVRDRAGAARDAAADRIEANPLGIVAGGLAIGALIGAIIPRTQQEKDLLAPLGTILGERARAVLAAAKETARTELDANGLTRNAAQAQVRGLVDSLTKVARNVGTAAAKSATDRR